MATKPAKSGLYNPFSAHATIIMLAFLVFVLIFMIKAVQQTQVYQPQASACIPRPACLDANPRCAIPEPQEGWCPR